MLAGTAVVVAQPPPADGVGPETPAPPQTAPKFTRLVEPLDAVRGNMLDLESEGWFTIVNARLEKTAFNQRDALIWTLRVNRPLLCSHALLFLDRFKDVRFYFRVPQTQLAGRLPPTFEVFRTVINYPDRITTGAANDEMLQTDDTFDIWVYLRPIDIAHIIGRRANVVVFSEYGRLRRKKVWREYLKPAVDQSPEVPGR